MFDFPTWAERPRLLDGGMGTSLISLGLDLALESTGDWNERQPEKVAEVHRQFVQAGAEAVHSNSFGALGTDEPKRAGETAAALAHAATEGNAFVFGSIGPLGKAVDDLADRVRDLADGLAAGGAVLLHVETLYDPSEANVLLSELLAWGKLPLVASVACRNGAQGPETILGQPLSEFLAALPIPSLAAVGLNCSLNPDAMSQSIEALRSFSKPIFAQPTPVPVRPDGSPDGTPLTPAEFVKGCEELALKGATVIGGCCGTSHEHVAALSSSEVLLSLSPDR